jgi:hypothetical protein
MEIVDFTKNEKDWWAWFTLHSKEAVEQLANSEGFNPQALNVEINVNGVSVLSKPFNKLMDTLVELATEQRIQELGLHSVTAAAKVEARSILKSMCADVEDRVGDLLNQIEQVKSGADSIINVWYDAPFLSSINAHLVSLLEKAVVTNDGKEKYQSFEASLETDDHGPMGSYQISATGYGATEAEARTELEKALFRGVGAKRLESTA